MASSKINYSLPEDTDAVIKKVLYKYVWPSNFSVAANGTGKVTAANFGFSTPSGYTISGVGRYTAGSVHLLPYYVNPKATGSNSAIAFRNSTSSVQSGKTSYIEIIYIRSTFINTHEYSNY